jgi:dockerin type I repeat protein
VTPSVTATFTPTPSAAVIVVGHVTWQGRPAQPNAAQQLPITLTVRSGALEINYPQQSTDASGFFTVSVPLPFTTYTYRVKGPNDTPNTNTTPGFLANSGTFPTSGAGGVSQVEMGLMRAGDANNDNVVNVQDFNIVKSTFGKSVGQPGYDGRADFNGDNVVNISDFNLLHANFGTAGAPPIRP